MQKNTSVALLPASNHGSFEDDDGTAAIPRVANELDSSADEKEEETTAADPGDILMFHHAIFRGDLKVVKETLASIDNGTKDKSLMLSKNANDLPIHTVCRSNADNAYNIADCLIQWEVKYAENNPGHKDSRLQKRRNGDIALHVACRHNNYQLISLLLRNFTDVQLFEKTKYFGNTALHMAAYENNEKIVKMLLNYCSNPPKLIKERNTKEENTAVHLAALQGNIRILELLYDTDKNCFSYNGKLERSPLHTACASGQLKAVEKIIELLQNRRGSSSATQASHIKWISRSNDAYGDMSPLALACKYGHADIVDFLLSSGNAEPCEKSFKEAIHRSYKACVKHLVLWSDDRTLTDCLAESSVSPGILNMLIKEMPDVAQIVLDKYTDIQLRTEVSTKRWYQVKLRDVASVKMKYGLIALSCRRSAREEQHPLKAMVDNGNANLLKHPVVASYIYENWSSRRGVFNFLYWLLYVFFVVVTSTLLFTLPNPTSTTCANTENTTGNNAGAADSNNDPSTSAVIGYNILAVLMFLYSFVRFFIIELFQFIRSLHKKISFEGFRQSSYIFDYSNWIEIPLFLLSFIYSIVVLASNRKSFCLSGSEWQIGVFVMCLTWLELIYASRQFWFIGIYAMTFWKVFLTVVKFIPFASLLIIAFGFSFYLLLYQSTFEGSPFYTPQYSVLAAYAMLSGGSISDVFGLDINAKTRVTSHLRYEGLTVIFWILALLLISIILTNVMIGLAVDGIKGLFSEASLKKLKYQIEYLVEASEVQEYGCCSKCLNPNLKEEVTYRPNSTRYYIRQGIKRLLVGLLWGRTPFDSEIVIRDLLHRQALWPAKNHSARA